MSNEFDEFSEDQNPFAAHDEPEYSTSGPRRQYDFGMLSQIKPFGICMLIQAGLEILWAGFCVLIATVLPELLGRLGNGPRGPQPPPEEFKAIMLVTYGAMGAAIFSIAILRIFAALKVMQYQGRTLTFVSLGSGVLTLFTGCYCLPTAIGLMVWGIIILINDPVKRAFEMRTAGTDKQGIDKAFGLSERY